MTELNNAFDTFHDRISLGATPWSKIESAFGGLRSYLTDACDLPEDAVLLQGSVCNATAVEPAEPDGEYDADVIAICAAPDASADQALDDLEAVLAAHGSYAALIKKEGARKKPCVRLRYAGDSVGGFHVDVVPARASQSSDVQAPLEAPRRGDGWHDTAPEEYTAWCAERGERFARTVKMLKRWREVHQPAHASIKSIVLQVLAADAVGSQTSDGVALCATLEEMQTRLSASPDSAPQIPNPVLAREDLGARWTDAAYRNFRKELDEAVDLAQQALWCTDDAESHGLWQELLGDDFPAAPTEAAKRVRIPPSVPAPGFERTPQEPPRRERYGR